MSTDEQLIRTNDGHNQKEWQETCLIHHYEDRVNNTPPLPESFESLEQEKQWYRDWKEQYRADWESVQLAFQGIADPTPFPPDATDYNGHFRNYE